MTRSATAVAPSPRGLPFVGHLPQFLHDKLGFLTRAARTHGDAVWLDVGGPVLLVNARDDIRQVLITNAANYRKSRRMISDEGRALLGNGVLTASGETHRRQRRVLLANLQGNALPDLHRAVSAAIARRTSRWSNSAVVDGAEEMSAISCDAILRVAFGSDFEDDGRLAAAVAARRAFIDHTFLANPIQRLRRKPRADFDRAMELIDETVQDGIARGRASGSARGLLGALLQVRFGDGSPMPDDLIRDEIVTLLVTGHETVGDGLTWTWYLLARHPETRERLERECDDVISEGTAPSFEQVRSLRRALQANLESMRLFPPTWIFVRESADADRLPSGVAVPAGSRVYLCPWVTHRDPQQFDDPAQFDPDRWTPEFERRTRNAPYFPFGAGPRLCIGEQLARLEMTLVVATIARRFRLDLTTDRAVTPDPRITLAPRGGLPLRITAR